MFIIFVVNKFNNFGIIVIIVMYYFLYIWVFVSLFIIVKGYFRIFGYKINCLFWVIDIFKYKYLNEFDI